QNFDEFIHTHQAGPAAANVAVQAQSLILREDEDAAQIAIQAVRKRNINNAVDAAEGYCRFRAVAGEGPKAFALSAGEKDSNGVAHHGHGKPRHLILTAVKPKDAQLSQAKAQAAEPSESGRICIH